MASETVKKLLEIRDLKREVDFRIEINVFGLRSEFSERTLCIDRAFRVGVRLRSSCT